MRFLGLARDAVREDGNFLAGIPAAGRMSAEQANYAFHAWDSGRRRAQVRAALSGLRKVTPTGTGMTDPLNVRDRFNDLQTSRSDLAFYPTYTNANVLVPNDLMVVNLDSPTVSISTLVPAANSIAFYSIDNVGDGRIYRAGTDPLGTYPTIVVNVGSGATTNYTNIRRFLDPRIGGKKYAYVKDDNSWVATDTIGSAETPIFTGYSVDLDLDYFLPDLGGGYSYNIGDSVWLDELGLFTIFPFPFGGYEWVNALGWSRKGASQIKPVPGSASEATKLYSLGDRLITDNGLLCEDHRKGSQVRITYDPVVGTWNGVVYTVDYDNGRIGFSAELSEDSFEYVDVAPPGEIFGVRVVHDRLWIILNGATYWLCSGVLP